jgi:two-component system NtrC family sensor kinase
MDEFAILYVDDEWSNRIVFEKTFAKDFRIRCAASGEEALEILRTEAIAVLVADQRMPGMTGNELLEKAKTLYPDVIRVVITAYSDVDPILRAVNEGLVARYLVKPWDREELERLLGWAIEAFSMGRSHSEIQLRLLKTERLVTIGSLTGTLLHELDNLLSHCKNNTERLTQLAKAAETIRKAVAAAPSLTADERRALSDLAEELPAIATDLQQGGTVMQTLVANTRNVLRVPSSGADACDPKAVIDFALNLHRGALKRTQLAFDGPATLPRVRIGMTELTQVLLNLLQNAVQAVEAAKRPGHIALNAREDGDRVRIAITDDGLGMTDEVKAKAGTLFYSTRAEGTGVGLANCRRLVERADGTMEIESSPERGTTVTVLLPRATTSP